MSQGLTPRDALEALQSWFGAWGDREQEAHDVLLALIERAEQPGPTLYGTLAAKRTEIPGEAVAAALSAAFATVQAQMRTAVAQALGALYAEGVRDGFVQGVAAECARRDENGGGES